MGLLLLGIAYLAVSGRRNLRVLGLDHPDIPANSWPPISVIVPATGSDPAMISSIRALLCQNYPAFELLFVTSCMDDPATAVIRLEITGHPFAKHVCSGKATACSQKNHNLLAGVREADSAVRVLVFCDCGHLADPAWLKTMVAPMVIDQVQLTTAYHHVIPRTSSLAAVGRAVNVLFMHLAQSIPWLTQPWGGATAISRNLFQKLRVEELWAGNVVDDVSLVPPLRKAGVKAVLVPTACLSTPLEHETMSGWTEWLTRQILYLKFCLPFSWAAAGAILYLLAALVVLSATRCIAGSIGLISPAGILLPLAFLTALGGVGIFLRRLHPAPAPLWRWLISVYVTPIVSAWSHLKTLSAREIRWRGITYRVTWKGRVEEIRER
jgi:cellulose synthase/poly-beta-1,6-N-acetylglucosamine synthase-like glycosyltransferase